jgi:hypothetical protein
MLLLQMLEMPNILPRMVHILRVINYGPNLADLISHNIAPQVPITSDILTFFSSSLGISDWDHFAHLEQILQQGSSAGPGEEGSSPSRSGWSSANSSMRCKYLTANYFMMRSAQRCGGCGLMIKLSLHSGSAVFSLQRPPTVSFTVFLPLCLFSTHPHHSTRSAPRQRGPVHPR